MVEAFLLEKGKVSRGTALARNAYNVGAAHWEQVSDKDEREATLFLKCLRDLAVDPSSDPSAVWTAAGQSIFAQVMFLFTKECIYEQLSNRS